MKGVGAPCIRKKKMGSELIDLFNYVRDGAKRFLSGSINGKN